MNLNHTEGQAVPQRSVLILLTSILCLAGLVWLLAGLADYAFFAPPGFDGALNLNTAASFARGTGYGFIYDSFFAFPAQTDGPFILPAALAIWIGGVTPLTTQIVSLTYVAVFLVLVVLLFRHFFAPLWLALLGALVCASTPGFREYGMNGFGEIAVLAWFIAGLLVAVPAFDEEPARSTRFFWTGLLFAMAYLTKVVALICVVPACAVLILVPLARYGRVQRLVLLWLGFAVPVAAWEIFRFVELAGSHAYVRWWLLQLGQIRSQSGASRGLGLTALLQKGQIHLGILSGLTSVPVNLLLLYLIAPIGIAALLLLLSKRPMSQRVLLGALTLVNAGYFVWWLMITPTGMAWLRRIVDGLILQQCLVIVLVAILLAPRHARTSSGYSITQTVRSLAIFGLVPVLVPQIFLMREGEFLSRPLQAPAQAADLFHAARTIRDLPSDATIFGTGWWQAPVLALFSQRAVMNLAHWEPADVNALPRKYFITDAEAQAIAPGEIKEQMSKMRYTTVMHSSGGSIYEMLQVIPFQPFQAEDEDTSKLSDRFEVAAGNDEHSRGIYRAEGELAWSRPDSAVMLKRSNEDRILVDLYVPPHVSSRNNSDQLQLNVRSAGCLDAVVPIVVGRRERIELHLDCATSTVPKAMEVTFHLNDHMPFVHQLDADSRLLGFLLRSVRLEKNTEH